MSEVSPRDFEKLREPHEADRLHDECGVFGIHGADEAANITYLGLYALQHRGQESCGIVASDGHEHRPPQSARASPAAHPR